MLLHSPAIAMCHAYRYRLPNSLAPDCQRAIYKYGCWNRIRTCGFDVNSIAHYLTMVSSSFLTLLYYTSKIKSCQVLFTPNLKKVEKKSPTPCKIRSARLLSLVALVGFEPTEAFANRRMRPTSLTTTLQCDFK